MSGQFLVHTSRFFVREFLIVVLYHVIYPITHLMLPTPQDRQTPMITLPSRRTLIFRTVIMSIQGSHLSGNPDNYNMTFPGFSVNFQVLIHYFKSNLQVVVDLHPL